MSKTIKISNPVHTELKLFVAKSKDTIEEFAGYAIMLELKNSGHKFSQPSSKIKIK